jgi:hypothetical protein
MNIRNPTTISDVADELERFQNELRRLQRAVEIMERAEKKSSIPSPPADEL